MTLSRKVELSILAWKMRLARAREAHVNHMYVKDYFSRIDQGRDRFDIYVIGDNVATIRSCTPVLAGHWIHLGGTQVKTWTVLEIEVQKRPRPSVLPNRMTIHIN